MDDTKTIREQLTRNLPERLDTLGELCGLSRQILMGVLKTGLTLFVDNYVQNFPDYFKDLVVRGQIPISYKVKLVFRQSVFARLRDIPETVCLDPTGESPHIILQIHPLQTEGPPDLMTPVTTITTGLYVTPEYSKQVAPILRGLIDYLTATMRADEPQIKPIRSVMDPVPIPRGSAAQAGITAKTSAIEGLGRLFTGYRSIPDLDILGEIATKEADTLFWTYLEKHLDETLPGQWEKELVNSGEIRLTFRGVQVDKAKRIWREATETMNAGKGGPGLLVADPDYQRNNRMEGGEPVIKTTVLLWPEGHLKPRWGEAAPAVTFRRRSSPGYMALLKRHSPGDYFADGWLWKTYGNTIEGFRIGGLDRLLYPEGREAIERIRRRRVEDIDTELNRVLQNPTLFKDEDQEVVAGLQRAKTRAAQVIERLSVYGWEETAKCILEAFFRQQDAWANGKVKLPNSKEIITDPIRLIILDPNDLMARLDPGRRWGQNWRAQMFNRLEALTTFQRQTRTIGGKTVDVGDTFLRRAIDGRRPEVDEKEPGLIPMLQRGGAIPSNFFFVEISFDFINQLFIRETDSKGVLHWGFDAGKAAQEKAIASGMKQTAAREKRREVERRARAVPTYDHSPRLMSLSNLERWPQNKKNLANTIHKEKTPNYEPSKNRSGRTRRRRTDNRLGGKEKLENIDSEDFIAFNGNRDHGYRLRTWAEKVPMPAGAKGYREIILYLKALHKELGLRVRVGAESWTTSEALDKLETGVNSPSIAGTILKMYLPVDMEHKLADQLLDAGIDSISRPDTTPPALRPMWPKGPTPGELREARKKAGLKQGDLAQKIGVAQQSVSLWERGEVKPPKDKRAELTKILSLSY